VNDELREFLAARGVGPAARIRPLEGGEENENLLVEEGERRLVLRQYRWRSETDVAWELAVVRHLAERGFPTPPVIGDQGWMAGRPAALFLFVEGRHPESGSLAAAEIVVQALAELHELTSALELPAGRSGDDMWRMERFRREVVDEGAHRAHPEISDFVRQIDAFQEFFIARTARLWPDLPLAVVHHDAHTGNVLFDEAGRLVSLLDFDMAHVGPRVSELASLIHCWASQPYPSADIDWPRARHVALAYGPLAAAEIEALPYLVGLYYIADAASYVRNRLERNPAYMAVSGCSMWSRFGRLTAEADWPTRILQNLAL
jgi:homoserine kinase type II